MIDRPMHFEEAIRFLLEKRPNPEEWDSADWAAEKPAVRVRSFFSSRVESARFLDRAQGLIFDYLVKVRDEVTTPDGQRTTALRVGGREDFVMLMRRFMIEEGMAGAEEFRNVNQNDLEDIRSVSRLRLIFDTNVRQAYGYGQWRQGMKPAVRRAFPAARFIRVRDVFEPRPRHAAHVNDVRLKSDMDWWAKYQNDPAIGGFGVPWGPYGFHSGMGQEDVSRADAERLGLKVDTGGEEMEPNQLPGLNDELAASVRKMDPDVKAKLLEELRGGPKPRDAEEAGRDAAAAARRAALERRGLPADAPLEVKEIGGEIRLREDIGERISKARKRKGMATPEQEQAIADAVFRRIDRKAAQPQARAEGGKGADRGRQLLAGELTLTPEERIILESPLEILLIHTEEGRLQKAVMGGRRTVTIPDKLPPRAIISHNHPGGLGPSASDLKAALSREGLTLRIVTTNEDGKVEVFSIQAKDALGSGHIDAISKLYKEACKSGGDTATARRNALALILESAGDKLSVVSRIFS